MQRHPEMPRGYVEVCVNCSTPVLPNANQCMACGRYFHRRAQPPSYQQTGHSQENWLNAPQAYPQYQHDRTVPPVPKEKKDKKLKKERKKKLREKTVESSSDEEEEQLVRTTIRKNRHVPEPEPVVPEPEPVVPKPEPVPEQVVHDESEKKKHKKKRKDKFVTKKHTSEEDDKPVVMDDKTRVYKLVRQD